MFVKHVGKCLADCFNFTWIGGSHGHSDDLVLLDDHNVVLLAQISASVTLWLEYQFVVHQKG